MSHDKSGEDFGALLEEFEKKGKTNIKSNVDFYSGSVYHLMGIPADVMTPIFAIFLYLILLNL